MSKTFRVFVSSTFQDLKAERNVLQEQTFHRLLGYCRERGASFQAIDLRWGVSEQASLDQQAMNICLGEIRRCQNITPRPNFFVLLGQRYGWRPPPPQVPADVFERMLQVVSEGERELLGQWYCRDDNSVPPEYILLPRDPEGPYAEHKNWQPVEQALYEAVCTGAKAMGLKGPDLLPWFASATHQEIAAGALSVANPGDKVVCAFREIQDAPVDRQGNPTGGAEAFIDSNQHDIRELKAELKGLIPQRNIRDYTARWSKTAGQPTREYLDGFADDVFAALREQVDRELEDPTPREKREAYCIQPDAALDAEGRAHHEVAEGHLTHFVGRDVILGRIADYMGADEPHPLVISGEGGTGKSALMAKAIEQTQKSQPQAQLVYRFIGATPASSSTRSLLRGLCRELCRRYGGDEAEVPEDHNELSTDFRERLEAVASSAPLALVLDALDQIPEGDLGRTLAWIPNELPEHVRLVVSRRPVQTLDALQSRRPEVLELGGMSPEEGNVLLDTWLDDAGRALQAAQRAEVDQKFAQSESRPLYLRLAFEEARRWPSWQEPETLASGMEGIIRNNLFARLAHEEHHGPVLISRALSYLAASRYGLAEDEILSVLSRDPEVYAWFLRNTYHLPPDIVACAQHYLHDQGQQIDTNKATAWLEGLRRDEQQLRKVLTEMLAGPKGPHLPVVLWARLLDGVPRTARAKSVVVAAGGFQANIEWLKEFWGEAADNFLIRGTPYDKGRLLRILLDNGAKPVGDPRQCHAVAIDARAPKFDGGIVTRLDCVSFGIVVNKNAQRFYDEGEDFWPKRYAIWGRLVAKQPDQIAYSIIDSKSIDLFMPSVFPPFEASSIKEMAALLELDPAALEQTVFAFNGATRPGTFNTTVMDDCTTEGLDPPKSHWARPLDTPPFYGYPLRPGITFTYLGVTVDEQAGTPSANIFAAGEIMSGNILGKGYMAGFGMTIGTVFGRTAGKGAARYASD